MAKTTYTDNSYRTFVEQVAAALDGKEDYLVALGSNDDAVQLAGSSLAIGVIQSKLQPGDTAVNVRLLGKGGTVRMIQSAAIAKGTRVIADTSNSGQVKALPGTSGTYRVLGIKLSAGNGAANDVIEVLDAIETVIVP